MMRVYANSYLLHVHWGVLVSVFTAEDAVWFVCVVYVAPLTVPRCAYQFLQQEMQGGVCGLCSTFNSAQVCVYLFPQQEMQHDFCVLFM